jgi:hypothetical protein
MRFVFIFSRHLVVPAILLNTALIIMIVGSSLALANITVPQPQIQNYLIAVLIDLIALISGVTILVLAFGSWLLQLTIFCRSYIMFDANEVTPDADTLNKIYASAREHVSGRKLYFAKFWLITSLFAGVPFALLMLLLGMKVASMAEILGTQAILLSPHMVRIMNVSIPILALFIISYSAVALVICSNSTRPPTSAAIEALFLTFKFAPAIVVLTIGFVVVNFLVSAPQQILSLGHFEQLLIPKIDLWSSVGGQLWQGVTSVILWPLSIAPICEVLREVVE